MNKEKQRQLESNFARERVIAIRAVILIVAFASLAGWAALLASV